MSRQSDEEVLEGADLSNPPSSKSAADEAGKKVLEEEFGIVVRYPTQGTSGPESMTGQFDSNLSRGSHPDTAVIPAHLEGLIARGHNEDLSKIPPHMDQFISRGHNAELSKIPAHMHDLITLGTPKDGTEER